MNKFYPSAKNTILGLIIWGALLVPYAFAVYDIFKGSVTSELLIRMGILSLVVLLFGAIWFGTGYYISNGKLFVKIGPFAHSNYDISLINEIVKTNSWISAPAISFNRLTIKSHDRTLVIVSPKDQEGFIKALKAINPDINTDF